MPQRPTQSIFTPSREATEAVIDVLLSAGEVFTVEPSQTQPGCVWHIGIMDSALPLLTGLFGPARDVGTVGDFRID